MAHASLDEIIEIIGNQLGAADIHPTHRIVEDLGAESADVANIVAAVEDRYGITVAVENIADLQTVQDVFMAVQNA